jgi:hypothetical protein
MRGAKAKKLRKMVYGKDFSPKHREYYKLTATGQIVADDKRQSYQKAKRGEK